LGVPEYVVTESGPDHEKTFQATARVAGSDYGSGAGRSKKEAEQQAAEAAWTFLSETYAAQLAGNNPAASA
ncbi:MAG TPA: putative dsRNA-binding protein, partial [Sporichthya sp.]|nr:putative dsRNA-binding protein [Sporichthya sp.]